MGNFKSDLDFGKKAEEWVSLELQDALSKKGEPVLVKEKGHDIMICLKVEVKSDRLTPRTGNVAVEIECSGQPSGLTSTDSDIWVWEIAGRRYWVKVSDLREYIKEKHPPVVMGGDGARSKMVLIHMFDFLTLLAHSI